MAIFNCSNWSLNTSARSISKRGKYVRITPKAFNILVYLIERRERAVSKEEILDNLWVGTVVEEGNLSVHVSKIRRVLCDTVEERIIETVPGFGYRFVGQINEVDVDVNFPFANLGDVNSAWHRPTRTRVAVLPLELRSSAENSEFLIEGIFEDLTYGLSLTPFLEVISRNTAFKYKNSTAHAQEIGFTLGANYIVTGRVRITHDRISLSAEMTRVADDIQIWGGIYQVDVDQVSDLQDLLKHDVVKCLSSIAGEKSAYRNSDGLLGSETSHLRLRSKQLMQVREPEQLFRAMKLLENVIEIAPEFRDSYAELIECILLLYGYGYISRSEALKRLKPTLEWTKGRVVLDDAVLSALAGVELVCHINFPNALLLLRDALRRNPNNVNALRRMADILLSLGRPDEAMFRLEYLEVIDPLSFSTLCFLGRCYFRMGKIEIAESYFFDALQMEPRNYAALTLRGACLIELARFEEARAAFRRSLELFEHPETHYFLAYCSARSGDLETAREELSVLLRTFKPEYSIYAARIYSELGDFDEAFRLLDVAVELNDPDLRGLGSDPRWFRLIDDERFAKLLRKVAIVTDAASRERLFPTSRGPA